MLRPSHENLKTRFFMAKSFDEYEILERLRSLESEDDDSTEFESVDEWSKHFEGCHKKIFKYFYKLLTRIDDLQDELEILTNVNQVLSTENEVINDFRKWISNFFRICLFQKIRKEIKPDSY
jgi:hypothetical protein